MKCICEQCKIEIVPYDKKLSYKNIKKNDNGKRIGVVVHSVDNEMFLLVQSCGNLWGFPKGMRENNESLKHTAVRELEEESGIKILESDLTKFICIRQKALYYFYGIQMYHGRVQSNVKNNDANGLMWIQKKCLLNLIETKTITLTAHTYTVLKNSFKLNI